MQSSCQHFSPFGETQAQIHCILLGPNLLRVQSITNNVRLSTHEKTKTFSHKKDPSAHSHMDRYMYIKMHRYDLRASIKYQTQNTSVHNIGRNHHQILQVQEYVVCVPNTRPQFTGISIQTLCAEIPQSMALRHILSIPTQIA